MSVVGPLEAARAVATAVVQVTHATLLLAHPDRYLFWTRDAGAEVARLRAVDMLCRAVATLEHVEREGELGHELDELGGSLRALLVLAVAWDGALPIPEPIVSASQATLPLLGVGHLRRDGFEPWELPTLPAGNRDLDALEALRDDHLADESTDLRLLLGRLVQRGHLTGALLEDRRGEVVVHVGHGQNFAHRSAFDPSDPIELIADLLETLDLYAAFSLGQGAAAVRQTGLHSVLVATAPSREALGLLREAALGPALDALLDTAHVRLERVSAPPSSSAHVG